MIFGTNANDFYGSNYTINLDGNGNMNNVTIGATNTVITFIGTQNTHLNAASTWTVAAGSVLNEGDTRHNGLNMNNEALTLAGGGTINFQTPMGANDNKVITQNMPGGTVNFQQTADVSGQIGFNGGGYTLTNGTMNFATAAAIAQVFDVLTNGVFSLNGGTLDNTSGSPGTLVMGTGATYSIGGNFTFTGSSSFDFGTHGVTNTANHTVTVSANTLSIGGVIKQVLATATAIPKLVARQFASLRREYIFRQYGRRRGHIPVDQWRFHFQQPVDGHQCDL